MRRLASLEQSRDSLLFNQFWIIIVRRVGRQSNMLFLVILLSNVQTGGGLRVRGHVFALDGIFMA